MELQKRRQALINALRSDQYRFGKGSLRHKGVEPDMCVFCFAGVMCDVYRIDNSDTCRWVDEGPTDNHMYFQVNGKSYTWWALAPKEVADYFGIPEDEDDSEELGEDIDINMDNLIHLNDKESSSDFSPIIDLLTTHWHKE